MPHISISFAVARSAGVRAHQLEMSCCRKVYSCGSIDKYFRYAHTIYPSTYLSCLGRVEVKLGIDALAAVDVPGARHGGPRTGRSGAAVYRTGG